MDYAWMVAGGVKVPEVKRVPRDFVARAFLRVSRLIHNRVADYYKHRLASCGEDVRIYPGVSMVYPEKIVLGHHVHLGERCHLIGGGSILIGDWSQIGNHVIIATGNHARGGLYYGRVVYRDVWIGPNVWIGSGAIVLPGARIGNNAIVAAGAVVTGTVRENTLVAGVPATVRGAVG